MSMVEEFRALGEQHFVEEPILVNQGFAEYVAWLERGERGELNNEGLVAWSALWAVEQDNGSLVGVSSLRYELSPWMAEYGGHIGYRVRPSMRRKGFGTQILSLTMERAVAHGINPMLVVCEPTNEPSIGVILKNGGVFEREVFVEGTIRRRYWLHVNETGA